MSRLLATLCLMTLTASAAEVGATKPLNLPLPDPLLAPDGHRITTAGEWTKLQRPHLLELFRANVYGRNTVERPAQLKFETRDEQTALSGKARRSQVRITYGGPGGEGHIDATLYVPTASAPRGVFLLIVNRFRSFIDEAETKPSEYWPVEQIVARGYATVAFHYSDTAVDKVADHFEHGVFPVYGPTPRQPDSWGALSAWAWGASRIIDYLETNPAVADKPVAVIGQSRGGKAALWCGAQDTRVALTISNESGSTGAALTRRKVGETVEIISRVFPHWFAENYRRFANHEADLPVDQHELIALVAPRLVYVGSAEEDTWSDPTSEFAACVEAGPVYQLFGLDGVGDPTMPKVDAPRQAGAIGYHMRAGKHNLLLVDWNHYLDFADRHWGKR
ncbi:MAG TPA: alpha/beta hydrolase [Lacunisphaera sp.]|nr:alpha/beta hydrolase [Lacunisphaera sp.]